MIDTFVQNEVYDTVEVEKSFPDLTLVYKVGKGGWTDHLYYIPSKDIYLAKGPYADRDAVCYKLCSFTDQAGADEWKANAEAYWRKHFPYIKLDP